MMTAQSVYTDPPRWTLGDRLRKARRLLHLDQPEIGALLGVSGAAVSKWERDDGKPEDVVATAQAIVRVAKERGEPGITAAWLLGLQPGGDPSVAKEQTRLNRPRVGIARAKAA